MPTTKQLLDAQIRIEANEAGTIASGAVGANGVTATTHVTGSVYRTVLSLSALVIAMADNAGVVAYGSKKLLDFPEGQIRINSVVPDIALTKSSAGIDATFDGDAGLGTVAANNGAALATTEQDIVNTTALAQAVAGATRFNAINSTPAIFDGSTTAVDLYLNLLVDDSDHDVTTTPANLVATGTVTILWENLGG